VVLSDRHLFIRTDANTIIGIGHLMRCLALAQAWKEHYGAVTFIGAYDSVGLRAKIVDEGFRLQSIQNTYPDPSDLETTLHTINCFPFENSWVVLDGYNFDEQYQLGLKQHGNMLLLIDDTAHQNHYAADIILNQNINAKELIYDCEFKTKFLLSSKYVLLRDEFLFYEQPNRIIPNIAKKLLVTLGGGDLMNETSTVLSALESINIENLLVRVIAGIGNRNIDALKSQAERGKHEIEILQDVSQMPQLMAWADIAISAAGSTCWELAFSGLPAVLIMTSKNQRNNLEYLVKYGSVTSVGSEMSMSIDVISQSIYNLITDKELREDMSSRGPLLVDGAGRDRVIEEIKKYKCEGTQ
jgi:UDP-2,4-diacetamido-2,4,6-trideoxy-beta-L-altropyranose hydrolase